MKTECEYLIVGGGMAADAAWTTLRRKAPDASLIMLSDEKYPPYQRPPLSKKLWTEQRMEDIWCPSGASPNLRLTCSAISLDTSRHELTTATGEVYGYGKLLIATGGTPLHLSDLHAAEDPGVLYFRGVEDYVSLRRLAQNAHSIALIGGGFIGAELSAALTSLGKEVSLIMPESSILARVLPEELATRVTQVYQEHGIKIFSASRATSVKQTSKGFEVHLHSGSSISADVVVAGLGIRPNTSLAESAGLGVANGIIVDSHLRTSHADVYAAGDVAAFPWGGSGPTVRVEHEDNALSQGRLAARNMLGQNQVYSHLPFFYSDLFQFGFEAVGRLDASLPVFSDWQVPGEEGVVYYLDQNRVVGILNWNVWDGIPEARRILQSGQIINDPNTVKGRIRNS